MTDHRHDRRRRIPVLESLESLQLLSASFLGGVWTVTGTRGADKITVDRDPQHPDMLRAFINGRQTATRAAATVQQVRLIGLGGNDTLEIDESHGTIKIDAVLRGGAGKNLLVGGSGSTLLDGGPGNKSVLQPGAGRTILARGIAADSVQRLGSLKAFRQSLARSAAKMGAGTGLKGPGDVMTPIANAPAAPSNAAGSHSTTNVQVAGVGEADIVQTDGSSLYVISRGELVIVDARKPDAMTVASRTTIDGSPIAEYLDGTRLTVLSSIWQPLGGVYSGRGGVVSPMPELWLRGAGRVAVTTFDVSDPTSPKVVTQTTLDGSYADSRMVDGKLYLVLQSDLFSGFWGGPIAYARLASGGSAATTRPTSLASAPVDKVLPGFDATVTAANGTKTTRSGLISRPQDILKPVLGDDANLMSVVVLDTRSATPGPVGTASLMGSYASTLHVTADRLYVFAPRWDESGGATTSIQEFALTGADPRLVATGTAPGTLVDQYSADASGGYLRVTTTSWRDGTSHNGLYVLQTQGDRLNVVGSIDDIAPGESLYSTRFQGDRAFLVTFQQVDPLWAIDLSNPTAPKVAGELTLPGFSRFLQPIGTDYLLGVGREADPATGRTTDLKLSLFDIHDLSHPALVASQAIAPSGIEWTWSAAEWDPHALGWFPELNVLAIPVQGSGPVQPLTTETDPGAVEWKSLSDLYVFHIDAAAGAKAFQSLGKVEHASSVMRSVRIDDVLYSIADQDVQSVRVIDNGLSALGQVTIQTDTSGWPGNPVPVVAIAQAK